MAPLLSLLTAVYARSTAPCATMRGGSNAFLLLLVIGLLVMDALLTALVIAKVPYTEIDWKAYMQEVGAYLDGERDYVNMKGDTGPLVYPAGFVYVYATLQRITGGGVVANAQPVFAAFYILYVALAAAITVRAGVAPPVALAMLCLSKRLHSIFVLRLFNDGVAMLPALLAIVLAQTRTSSTVARDVGVGALLSLGVSVKMNVLLMAPAAAVLWLQHPKGVWNALAGAAAVLTVQLAVGYEFLSTYPASYLRKAFEFGRVFLHVWTVNFKFVPEEIFVSKRFALSLLAVHLVVLLWFGHRRWCTQPGGLVRLLREQGFGRLLGGKGNASLAPKRENHAAHATTALLVANFVGVCFARSLHYQFYSWYAFSLPHLLYTARLFPWETSNPVRRETLPLVSHAARFAMWLAIEMIWNVYPSNATSSVLLNVLHGTLLLGLAAAHVGSGREARIDRDESATRKSARLASKKTS